MIVKFVLNGDDVTLNTDADTRLIDILRNSFGLVGAKNGCLSGSCGACFVLFNGKAASSCIIPAFRLRGSEIITIEGFIQYNEYQDIASGFAQARVEFCGFCDTGRVFVTEALLEKKPRPSREEILDAFSGIKCRCTEPESLVSGVLAAAEFRQRRLYGRGA
ncbi:MAG: 2Fe-2S iron-sulfur cluster binding domain-containing protein [Spirochaetaceae bacterium]|jgi:carbon-monoxide dehydrogenase small subunit|nr:2Fe-2S iron-sulfur cluster binding domain-containing protein [Spirochaetaceae bacterium]